MEGMLYQRIAPKIIALRQQTQNPMQGPPTKEEFVRYFTEQHPQIIDLAMYALIKTGLPLTAIFFFEYLNGWESSSLATLLKCGFGCATGLEAGLLIFLHTMTPEGIDWFSQKMSELGTGLA